MSVHELRQLSSVYIHTMDGPAPSLHRESTNSLIHVEE